MRLKSIKLAGFKSFAEPSKFAFPSNITCIVGPNGCGKSNTLDAIRWVMGESAAKALRGGDMNDVLFNGTDRRKPVSQASVELLFDNSDHQLKGPWNRYGQISVRRVHHREQGTQYYLNGQRCRRRDIQALFDGTGLGPRSYALIGQGNISQIIEARPEQLRLFLEEVAGVGYYRQRRKEALARLEATEENLVQLQIQYDTWSAQAEQLSLQTEAAQRFKTLQAEIKSLTRLRYQLGYQQLLKRQAQTQTALSQQQRTLIQCQQRWESAQKERILLEKQLPDYKAVFEQAQADCHKKDKAQALLKADYARQQRQKAQLKTQQAQLQAQQQALSDQLHTIKQRLNALKQKQTALEAQQDWSAVRNQLQEMAAQLQALQQSVADVGRAVQQYDYKLREARQKKSTLEHEQHTCVLSIEHVRAQLASVERHLKEAEQDEKALNLSALEADTTAAARQLEQAQQVLNTHQSQLETAEAQLKAAQTEHLTVVQARHKVSAQLEGLRALQEKAAATQAKPPPAAKPIMELIEVKDPNWADAVESWLGERLSGVLMSQWHDPPIAPYMVVEQEGQVASATPPVAHWQPLCELLDGPFGILQAASSVFCSAKAPSPEELSLLAPHQQVLTPDGRVWTSASVYTATQAQSGILTRKLEIQALEADLKALEAQESVAREHVQSAEDELKQQQTQYQALQAALTQTQAQYQSLSLELKHTKRQHEKHQRQQAQWLQEKTRLTTRLNELTAQKESLDTQLKASETTLAELEAAYETAQSEFAQQKQALEEKRQVHDALQTKLREAEQQQAQLAQAMTQTEQQHALVQQQLEQIKGQFTQLQHTLQQETEIDAHHLIEAEQAYRAAQAQLKQDKAALEALEQRLARQRALESEAERAQLNAAQQLHQLEQTLSQLQQQLADWVREAEESGLNLALLQQVPLQHTYATRQEVDKALKKLQRQLDALGPVNMIAIEALDQLQGEMAQLKRQMEDVADAVHTLKSSISRMDRDSRKRLRETFEAVNEHFKHLFPKIFNGGKAHLDWVEPDVDPLQNGVVVMAQPPGKRNTRIQMLSGGEKTLTALALIFAIFELNPAPFCVLDEVDAPLDDANVNRFCALVKSMAEKVQFILITHNKITMSIVDQLLGVTMQESGVSRIVSVDLKTALDISGEEDL